MIRYRNFTNSIGDDGGGDVIDDGGDDDEGVDVDDSEGHLLIPNANRQYAVVGNCVMPATNMSHAGRL